MTQNFPNTGAGGGPGAESWFERQARQREQRRQERQFKKWENARYEIDAALNDLSQAGASAAGVVAYRRVDQLVRRHFPQTYETSLYEALRGINFDARALFSPLMGNVHTVDGRVVEVFQRRFPPRRESQPS